MLLHDKHPVFSEYFVISVGISTIKKCSLKHGYLDAYSMTQNYICHSENLNKDVMILNI